MHMCMHMYVATCTIMHMYSDRHVKFPDVHVHVGNGCSHLELLTCRRGVPTHGTLSVPYGPHSRT